jgi:hypothetical protein
MNRKTFIAHLLRGGLLATLLVVAGILVSRKQVRLQRDCGLERACTDCRKRQTCEWVKDEEG